MYNISRTPRVYGAKYEIPPYMWDIEDDCKGVSHDELVMAMASDTRRRSQANEEKSSLSPGANIPMAHRAISVPNVVHPQSPVDIDRKPRSSVEVPRTRTGPFAKKSASRRRSLMIKGEKLAHLLTIYKIFNCICLSKKSELKGRHLVELCQRSGKRIPGTVKKKLLEKSKSGDTLYAKEFYDWLRASGMDMSKLVDILQTIQETSPTSRAASVQSRIHMRMDSRATEASDFSEFGAFRISPLPRGSGNPLTGWPAPHPVETPHSRKELEKMAKRANQAAEVAKATAHRVAQMPNRRPGSYQRVAEAAIRAAANAAEAAENLAQAMVKAEGSGNRVKQ
uniref:Uncharacterized protein n=1 Tax=Amorphochlora amoebiformis TaxID=1561963 RepID=A0A7S0DHP4_9EUKA